MSAVLHEIDAGVGVPFTSRVPRPDSGYDPVRLGAYCLIRGCCFQGARTRHLDFLPAIPGTTTSSTPLRRIQADPPALTPAAAVWSPPPFSFADASRVLSLQ
jgi:hypothetical protein